jgi:hypothetical protein
MLLDTDDDETIRLVVQYVARLRLPTDRLKVTTTRATYARWIKRQVGSAVGGAYVFVPRSREHVVLINLPRIDRRKPKAVEIIVAEELLHMRDAIDGDRRRHAKHGYDRIAYRVAEMTGASLEDVRTCLIPVARRPFRYVYACPSCGLLVRRRVRGTWSCRRCSPVFDPRFVLRLTDKEIGAEEGRPRT